jgi:hypothetical protein
MRKVIEATIESGDSALMQQNLLGGQTHGAIPKPAKTIGASSSVTHDRAKSPPRGLALLKTSNSEVTANGPSNGLGCMIHSPAGAAEQ